MNLENEHFVGEPVQLEPGSFAGAAAMARGLPGLPARFTWRDTTFTVVELLRQWTTTGPCRHGSGERYVRRHWFQIRVTPSAEMTLYCDRQARDRRRPKARWWLYSQRK